MPLFQLRNHYSRRSVVKLDLLHTPFTWSTPLHFDGAWKVHHVIHLMGDVRSIANRLRSGDRTGNPPPGHVLGVLAQMITSAAGPSPRSPSPSSRDVTHPHFNRRFGGLMSLRHRSDRPADVISPVWRCHCSPEHRDSTKCFLFTSCRGAIYPCFSYEFTTLAAQLSNSNSCTPPILRRRVRKKESL